LENKTAIITGITGQDGAYLASFLIQKGYKVIGVSRGINENNLFRLEYLGCISNLELICSDLTNKQEVISLIDNYQPDEIYNLGAQSSVGRSFKNPYDTYYYNIISVSTLLDGILAVNRKIKFYQASSSEMFGNIEKEKLPIIESRYFNPSSPYGVSKASAHWLTVNYRESFNVHACCGILFNHESCLREDNFVIKKIINTALKINSKEIGTLTLGDLSIIRDWGYAPKYVEAMWLMLQMDMPDDYIICSGNNDSLENIVLKVFDKLELDLNKHLRTNHEFIRPTELNAIYGDNNKAKKILKWNYNISTDSLIEILINDELEFIEWKKSF